MARALERLAITAQPRRSIVERRLVEERGNVVARRAHAHVVPIDEPGTGAVAVAGDEDVLPPEIAVQQRLGASGFLDEADLTGRCVEQPVQSLEQPAAGRG